MILDLDQTVDAVFSGYYDDGEGTEDIALSPAAFAALAGHPDIRKDLLWE